MFLPNSSVVYKKALHWVLVRHSVIPWPLHKDSSRFWKGIFFIEMKRLLRSPRLTLLASFILPWSHFRLPRAKIRMTNRTKMFLQLMSQFAKSTRK